MFRAGLHKWAIEYLLNYPNEEVRKFGEIYKDYYVTYKTQIPV